MRLARSFGGVIALSSLLAFGSLLAACDFRGVRSTFEISGSVPSLDENAPAFEAALFQSASARLLPGHRWSLEPNGRVFDSIISDIAAATVSINFVEYIWDPGEVSDRLLTAIGTRQNGVKCRVLADPLGSPDFQKVVAPKLRGMGCEAKLFRPVAMKNLFERNHRKMVIFDGKTAYLGGFGVRQEWGSKHRRHFRLTRRRFADEWRDDNIRMTGPVVNDVQRAFAQNWQEAGGALLPEDELPAIAPDGPARVGFVSSTAGYLTESERLVHLLIKSARRRVHIANAYFLPDESLMALLAEKVREGVDVRVLLPGSKNDLPLAKIGQRRLYNELLDGGVKLYEYQPTMMHAKTMVIDDRLAMIGSLNLNLLSLTRLEEAVFVIDDPELVKELDESWRYDLRESREIKPKN